MPLLLLALLSRLRTRCPSKVGLWGPAVLLTLPDFGQAKCHGRVLAVWVWTTPNPYLVTDAAVLKTQWNSAYYFQPASEEITLISPGT